MVICKGEDQEMESKMRKRADRVLVSVILVCILALVGIVVGITWILAANGPAGNQRALASQGTPELGVTHDFIHNYAYQPVYIPGYCCP